MGSGGVGGGGGAELKITCAFAEGERKRERERSGGGGEMGGVLCLPAGLIWSPVLLRLVPPQPPPLLKCLL